MDDLNKKILVKDIILFLATGGILVAGIIAPNAIQLFKFILKDDNEISFGKFSQSRMRFYVRRMQKQGFIKRIRKENQIVFMLTEKGKKIAKKYNIDQIKLKNQKKWDRVWRVIIFDIPEKKKKARDALRRKFLHLGMFQLQKSVFVYPFDCKKEIDFVSDFFNVGKDILYFEAKMFDIDDKLKKIFNL